MMNQGLDVVDKNGANHDQKGLFAPKGQSSAAASHKPFRIPAVKGQIPPKDFSRYIDSKGIAHATHVDTITDRPISAEYEDAINRLYSGEDIPLEKIEKIPELKIEQEFADVYCKYDRMMHPERYADSEKRIDDIYKRFSDPVITSKTNEALKDGESYAVKQGKEIWLVTGLPGSGKSTNFVGPISKANNARVVDCDSIKEQMPGFCRGLGANNVHERSKSINDRILSESLKRGDNIVYPVLGYNATYVGDQIQSMRRKGYKVHLVLNELPFAQSLARCLERRLKTGRNIPLAMFRKVGDRPSEAYETLKKQVDTFEKHSGDAVSSHLVEKGENKNLPPPKREMMYTYQGLPLGNVHPIAYSKHGDVSFPKQEKEPPKWHETFQVKQKKPMYWNHSWFGKHGKDSGMDAADGEVLTDEFGNLKISGLPSSVAQDSNRPTIKDIPEVFEGEIEGRETAHDLARFQYLMSGEDAED